MAASVFPRTHAAGVRHLARCCGQLGALRHNHRLSGIQLEAGFGRYNGAACTNIAQLKKFSFSGLKAEFDDITNLDSPSIFKEWMETIVEGNTVQFDGVMNPADPQTQALLANIALAGSAALYFWKITLTNGSTLVFTGYVQDFKFGAEYNKAITFSGAIKIVGNVTATW